jgi:hypothetical protein
MGGARRDGRTLAGGAAGAVLVAVALLVGLMPGLLGAAPVAAADTRTPLVSGWMPSWATPASVASVEGNPDLMGEASPFWYTARASGGSVALTSTLSTTTMASVLASLRTRGIPVLPSVADGSAARAMAGLLADPAARSRHVAQLVELTVANGYDGIELDYERFAFNDGRDTWATTRPNWVAFVTELGHALHRVGRKLALAVPVMYDGARSSTSGYWVYDYPAMAPVVDFLRIMTYDYSVARPGPIAPLAFQRRTLAYATSVFPASRIRLGIPAYGRLWTARRADGSRSITGTCPVSPKVPGTTSFTTAVATSYLTTIAGAPPVVAYDPVTGESRATFTKEYRGKDASGAEVSCLVDHVAWWMDAQGVAARMPLVAEFGLAGVAFWQLGGVDPASWAAMRAWAQGWTQPAPAPVAAPPGTQPPAVATKVTVRASTLAPKPRAKVTLKVRVAPKKQGIVVRRQMLVGDRWRTMATKRTGSKGRVTFTFRWPKAPTSNTYRVVTKATKSVPAGASAQFRITTRSG